MRGSLHDDHPFWKGVIPPTAIAHRGGAETYGPNKYRKENTIELFRATVDLGYKYQEIDVIDTADNQVIVIHVAKNTFEAAQAKKWAPSYKSLQKLTHEEIIDKLERDVPTLEQVLKAFPDTNLFVDAKSDKVVEPLAQVVSKLKARDRVCLGSFYPKRVSRLQDLLGDKLLTKLVVSRSPVHLFNQWRYYKTHSDFRSRLFGVDLPKIFASKMSIRYLHKRGLKVFIWTANTRREIEKSVNLGVDGIMTDNPMLLKEVISKHRG